MNRVYWLTGLSGAGKSTIGRLWYEELKKTGEPVVLLDGDELRTVLAAIWALLRRTGAGAQCVTRGCANCCQGRE